MLMGNLPELLRVASSKCVSELMLLAGNHNEDFWINKVQKIFYIFDLDGIRQAIRSL